MPKLTPEWQTYTVTIRYDWTDAEARAAGWTPAIQAFPWPETLQQVGKVTVVPLFGQRPTTFDLDEFSLETAFGAAAK